MSAAPEAAAGSLWSGTRAVLHRWAGEEDFAAGRFEGTRWRDGALRLAAPVGRAAYHDPFGHGCLDWEFARWTSPWTQLPFAAADLIPSWSADAPDGTRVDVLLQVRDGSGAVWGWYVLARWCAGDTVVHRATVPGQSDGGGRVEADTFLAGPLGVRASRVRVVLARRAGGFVRPSLTRVQAAASPYPRSRPPGPGPRPAGAGPGTAWGTVLDVPGRSQGAHTGHCPQWDGGGEAWAGPACTAMLVEYFGRGPAPADLAWLDPEDPAPQVDFAARQVYDHAYRGCGNWAFNVAYAARFGLEGAVLRLASLVDVEGFVSAGIPVATPLAARSGELSGGGAEFPAGHLYATAGNILVVRGFTVAGDVVVNDPLAASDDTTHRVYPRAAFERVWLTGGAAGAAYVVHPPGHPLPPRPPGEPPRW
ncbi:Peptidase_C39 like family protein [Actinacidiphila rubida]|uniref:Peptidase_C39 like family protein n=1 Tax=Actinacidiphila rubida TaxID=310780 RepID=A0A1H8S1F9_9ACTN|nr:C39 family peptidase [Actinacidiphila rubida]SEO72521.1 Peptidase_C39 like family protein [Actinacidiphila rubida]